jgi:hypothetical protein
VEAMQEHDVEMWYVFFLFFFCFFSFMGMFLFVEVFMGIFVLCLVEEFEKLKSGKVEMVKKRFGQ